MDDIRLTPIGVVHSPVGDGATMPMEGVPAEIEIFPAYVPALVDIAANSHLIILGWFHQAARDRLQAEGRHAPPGAPMRGVFGLRAPMRPNPIGLTIARLLEVDLAARRLRLDQLDFIDGTPIVDIKRYSPGWDSVFAARTGRDYQGSADQRQDELQRAAVNFHGEWCAGAAVGVALLAAALAAWQIAPRHPDLHVQVGRDGCLADALQGSTGATLGNGRITVTDQLTVILRYNEHTWRFTPRTDLPADPDAIRALPLEQLGQLQSEG